MAETAAPPSSTTAPARDAAACGFEDPNYQKSRQDWLNRIPRMVKYEAVDRYIGGLAFGLFSIAFGGLVGGAGLGLILAFAIGGITASAVGAYAHYQNRKVSEPLSIGHREQSDIARAKMQGQFLAAALEESAPRRDERRSDWAKGVEGSKEQKVPGTAPRGMG